MFLTICLCYSVTIAKLINLAAGLVVEILWACEEHGITQRSCSHVLRAVLRGAVLSHSVVSDSL